MFGADDGQFVLDGSKQEVTDADVAAKAKGVTGVGAVRIDRAKVTDAACAVFARWPGLYGVYLRDTQATGAGFSRLGEHGELRQVTLVGPKVNDAGVRAVAKLTRVTHLHVGNGARPGGNGYPTLVTGKALADVGSMAALTHLTIDNADISDGDLKHLEALRSAESVDFWRCPRLTKAGLARLQARLPKATIRAYEPELKLGK
jgi:hypothetical protein